MDHDMNKQGYDKEEEYFYKLNKELIKKMKKKEESAENKKENTDSDKPSEHSK